MHHCPNCCPGRPKPWQDQSPSEKGLTLALASLIGWGLWEFLRDDR